MITIDIPVSKAAKKYLTSQFGDRFEVSPVSQLGITILALLSKTPQSVRNEYTGVKYPERYSLYITEEQMNRDGCWLTKKSMMIIASQIEQDMRDFLFKHTLLIARSQPSMYKETMRNALDAFNITEEDLSLSAIMKDFDRKKDSQLPYKLINKGRIKLTA